MKNLAIFILFICAIAAFAFLPVYAFNISDASVYQAPLKRTSLWPPLDKQGEENAFVKTMFNRKHIYGSRFLSWQESVMTKPDAVALILNNLQALCHANVISEDIYKELEANINDPLTAVQCYTDAMDFISLYFSFNNLSISIEINTATDTVYKLSASTNLKQSLAVDAYIKYLSLDSFTDWQQGKDENSKYSQTAQLYVYVIPPYNHGGITLEVYPMTPEEFDKYN